MTPPVVVPGPDGALIARKRARTMAERDRLTHEAAVLALAAHPGVVRVIRSTHDELDLAYVGPHSLATRRPASTRAAVELLAAVADTLADLHRIGVVHGAVEPAHVLLDASGQPVLCGWSAGGKAGEQRRGGTATGGPRATVLQPSRDVYGLGCLGRFLLGEQPPHELRAVLVSATARDPADRPSAASCAAALRQAISPAGAPAGWRVRRPALLHHRAGRALAVTTALIATLVVAALVAGPDRRSTSDADVGDAVDGTTIAVGTTSDGTVGEPNGPEAPGQRGSPGTQIPADTPGDAVDAGARPCPGALVPDVPPFPAPPCTAAVVAPPTGLLVGGQRFQIGDPGDELLVVDPECTGAPGIVVIRPSTGDVSIFRHWATAGHDVEAEPLVRLPIGSQLETAEVGPDGCVPVIARLADGSTAAVT